jgi:hypothetical protein
MLMWSGLISGTTMGTSGASGERCCWKQRDTPLWHTLLPEPGSRLSSYRRLKTQSHLRSDFFDVFLAHLTTIFRTNSAWCLHCPSFSDCLSYFFPAERLLGGNDGEIKPWMIFHQGDKTLADHPVAPMTPFDIFSLSFPPITVYSQQKLHSINV